MTEQPAAKLVYRVSELAAFLGWHEDTIRAEIKAGRLVARKLRSVTVVTETDLHAWLDRLPVVDVESVQSETVETVPTPIARKPAGGRPRVQRRISIVSPVQQDAAR